MKSAATGRVVAPLLGRLQTTQLQPEVAGKGVEQDRLIFGDSSSGAYASCEKESKE